MTVPLAGSFLLTANYDALNDQITALETMATNVATNEVNSTSTRISTTYAVPDTGSPGPALTISMVSGKRYKITLSVEGSMSADLNVGRAAVALSGAITLAAADAYASTTTKTGGNTQCRSRIYTATATGSVTLTVQYKSSAGTYTFTNRQLIVEPMDP